MSTPHPYQGQIIEMIEAGKQVAEIRKALGCGKTTIYRWMRRLGIEPVALRPVGWKKVDWKIVRASYESGLSKADCLTKFGIIPETWSRAAREGKINLHPEDVPTLNEDLTGRQFDDWTVISRDESVPRGTNSRYWLCKCACGKEVVKTTLQIKYDSKSCGCRKLRHGSEAHAWEGYEEISLRHWNSIIKSNETRSKKILFQITIQEGWDLFIRQNRRCALSGILLTFGNNKHSPKTASLDRIDSSKNYTLDNVQWVHKDVNVMKMDHTQKEFLDWIEKIWLHQQTLK